MEGIDYKLALRPPGYDKLADFRVLVIDSHPLCPTARSVADALDALMARLEKAGCTILRDGAKLPDLAQTTRIFSELLTAFTSVNLPPEGT